MYFWAWLLKNWLLSTPFWGLQVLKGQWLLLFLYKALFLTFVRLLTTGSSDISGDVQAGPYTTSYSSFFFFSFYLLPLSTLRILYVITRKKNSLCSFHSLNYYYFIWWILSQLEAVNEGFLFVCFSSLFMTTALVPKIRVSQSMNQVGDSHEKMKNTCYLLSCVIHLPYLSHLFQKRMYGSFHIFR